MTRWLTKEGPDQDVVISTRLRVARNIANYKFPLFSSMEEADKVTDDVLNAVKESFKDENYNFYRTRDLGQKERQIYVEEHLISPFLVQHPEKSGFLVREDGRVTIMINEEDHLRIQTLTPGLNFDEGWRLCNEIDDRLEENLDFSFHEEFGYLTSCPTNVGTGLRASVMLHLPCLSITGHINSIIDSLRKIGLAVRGVYGEGSNASGFLYQISNQMTLGESEEEIINKLNKVIRQLVNRERNTRDWLVESRKIELEDRVYRSKGLLENSRIISSEEAINHLSNIKLGYEAGILMDDRLKNIFSLMIDIRPSNVQKDQSEDLTDTQRDIIRANKIRDYFENLEG